MTKCLKYTGLTRIEWNNKLQNLACQSHFQEYIQVSSKMVVTIEYQTDNLEFDPEIETLENAKSPLKEKKNLFGIQNGCLHSCSKR